MENIVQSQSIIDNYEFFQTITTVISSMGILGPVLYSVMYFMFHVELTSCTDSGKTIAQCQFYQGLLTSSKFGFIYSSLQVPMRMFQIFITTTSTK